METTRFFLRNVLVILLCCLVPVSFIHAGNLPKNINPSRVKEKPQRIRTISNKEIPAIENLEEITLKEFVAFYGNQGPVKIIIPNRPVQISNISFSSHHFEADCHSELLGCMRGCKKSIQPGMTRNDYDSMYKRCNKMCMDLYTACLEATSKVSTFATIASAIRWIYQNADVILLGTILVVGTASLIFISDGAAITLVPYSNYLMQQYMLSR